MYFKVKNVKNKPYLQFDLIASSQDELIAQGYELSSSGIIHLDVIKKIPFQFGIYLKRLGENGKLEAQPSTLVATAEQEYLPIKKQQLRKELKQLSIKIDLAEKLREPTENLYTEFNRIKADFDAIKII